METARTDASRQGKIIGTRHLRTSEGPGPRIMAADSLENTNVENPQGENLGQLEHIMLDVVAGRIAYAVLSFGGVFGIGEKLFAIPWTALQMDTDNKRFVLDVPKERLKQAEGFDKDHWPSMADQRWARGLHEFYGAPLYWE